MKLPVQVLPPADAPAPLDYRWDPDTDILTARVRRPLDVAVPLPGIGQLADGGRMSGPVGVGGNDGSWLLLDVEDGALAGIEIAVWPAMRHRDALRPPEAAAGQVELRTRRAGVAGPSLPEGGFAMTTRVTAESDVAERTIHFRLGASRESQPVRMGRDLLVEVDADGHLAGLWLLNVPPAPSLT